MARAIWSGSVTFGLVTIPVRLYSATSSHDVGFHQLERDTGARIRYRRVSEETGKEVDYDDIVKGYELDEGRYVVVTPEELEAIEPSKSRTIEIEDFVDLDDIDPVYFEKTYYLAPAEDVGAEKPYALLRQAMDATNKVGIARFVMRSKQYLAAIRPVDGLLAVETMFFADEVRSAGDLENVPGEVEVSSRERGMAEQLIESLATDFDPSRYHDTYTERVMNVIKRKAEGEEIVVEPTAETAEVVDLMEALQASVAASRRQEGEKVGGSVSGDGDLRRLSRDELYDRAADAGIPGRSKMSKDELVKALQKAS